MMDAPRIVAGNQVTVREGKDLRLNMGTCVLVDRFDECTDQNRIVGYTLLMDRSSFPEERLELRKDIFQVPANRIQEETNLVLLILQTDCQPGLS